jgi:LysM repeat protein
MLPIVVRAQVPVERSTEIVTIGAKEYYMHHVKAGETLFSISQAYQVPVEEIERLNPEVKDGLKAGQVIGIPVVIIQEDVETVVPSENVTENEGNVVRLGKNYVVQEGEDLYDIAKKFGIDVADFKAINPGLDNYPSAGTVINVPNIINEDDYIIHKVEYNERTSSLVKRWRVAESEFREKNISVGSHVFVNQVVLIPIEKVTVILEQAEVEPVNEPETVEQVEQPTETVPNEVTYFEEEETQEQRECDVDDRNASKRYKVVLMVPLYLDNIGGLDVDKEQVAKAQKSRSMSFLQFYEGFMMAVERMVDNEGLKLDLTVIDVTDNVVTAQDALETIEDMDIDLIVGPFFSKSFAIIEKYAEEKDIIMVNPLSTRDNVTEGHPNVVKVKAGTSGQIHDIAELVKSRYRDANVFIVSREKMADSLFLNALEPQLNKAINEVVSVPNEEFLEYARSESERLEMGEKMVPTVDVEGQVYSTNDLKANAEGDVVLHNSVKRYAYSEMSRLKSQLSGVRTNLIVAYGNDNVFATQVLNTLKKEADKKPITLVAVPDWTNFEKLLVDNLLSMNAIYFSDFFVDYRDDDVERFVLRFRRNYKCEPQEYAFEGYDVAWYFLHALMRYGNDFMDCLPSYSIPLLHTQYHFMSRGRHNGMENQSWSIYQYDNESIELNPINLYQKKQ